MTEIDHPEPCNGRLQLLEAAGQVFAESGYQQATVRTIVKRAGASLGAVNYHFRDKAGLYREVLALAHEKTIAELREAASEPEPAQRLQRFVRTKVAQTLVEDSERTWAGRVLAAELTSMGDDDQHELYDQFIAPIHALLYAILRDLLPPHVDDEVVARHGIGLIGECLMYCKHRRKVEIVYGRRLGEADLDWISRHIANVTLAGIRAETG